MGASAIEGQLWNPFTVTDFKISINVTNNPPYFPAGSIPDEIFVEIDNIKNF
jgi:hypothetical protein